MVVVLECQDREARPLQKKEENWGYSQIYLDLCFPWTFPPPSFEAAFSDLQFFRNLNLWQLPVKPLLT